EVPFDVVGVPGHSAERVDQRGDASARVALPPGHVPKRVGGRREVGGRGYLVDGDRTGNVGPAGDPWFVGERTGHRIVRSLAADAAALAVVGIAVVLAVTV